jgi:hypothetical protein
MKQLRSNRRLQLLSALVAVVTLAPAASRAAEHEIHGSNDFSVTYNDVTGPGAGSQSSLTEGGRYLEILNLFGNGRLGEFDYNWTVGAKATDDRRNDQKNTSLTNLQGRITNKTHTLTVGDTFESFSQYALNTAVKGGSYKYQRDGKFGTSLSALYGIAYSRWDNFWGVDAVERQVLGGKIKQNIGSDLWVGFSGVQTTDHVRVMGGELVDEHAYTVDFEYRPIPGLTILGESSWADGGTSTQDGQYNEFNGNASKLVAIGDGGPSRVTLEYERVAPGFRTMVGSATPDREKAKAKWRYKYTKNLTLTTAMLWYHNNLDGQLGYTTDHYKPEIGVTIKRPFKRQYAVADISYKLDRTRSQTVDTLDQFINTSYRDRFGVLDSDTNFGIIFYDTKSSRRAQEYTYNTALSSRHTVGKFVLKPGLFLGGWTSNEELMAPQATDQIYEYSVGLGVDIPAVKVTSNFKVGENRLEKEVGTDTAKFFANMNIFWRPDMLSKLQGMVYAKASSNSFRYDPNAVGGSQNFRETSVTGGISTQF